ncbi:DUF4280 domain-containing protein [Paenibacillus melissococcoides]|uniref:DUF4280 domain-containing protein n=1 Tax=Paenibacillus melissococcoides TaxID=2912268 RepID=A0ABN8U2Y7_9BACL|nr:DUF4280 domain-containing protein [Paenibacillus melissococcoides]CAH8244578.1 DUF4280 domain-containing protein [Paenibacillus melissococcoides]CAH8708399.1 DUF4280 domain-containing protein [Paenibacillus melissococcoides]CAH8709107.1 DUF4280 domain-containing protein [Paenibacillus melissococcoides]
MSKPQEIRIEPGKGAKESYVVAGAIVSCSYGTQPGRLKMLQSHGTYLKGKAQLNTGDFVPGINIPSFGNCFSPLNPAVQASNMVDIYGVKKAPCVPVVTIPWANGKGDVLVDGKPALLSRCTHQCLYCGTIRIENDGQDLD